MNLDNLTREELINLVKDLIITQEEYYKKVESKKLTAQDAFYRLAGGFQVMRRSNGIEPLYTATFPWPKLNINQ